MPIQTRVPPLPPELDLLRDYLQVRDVAPPSALPQIVTRETEELVTDFELDVLTWNYTQPDPTFGRQADGFILYVHVRRSGEPPALEPIGNGFKLSVETRMFFNWWPDGTERSYAIAAYRNTHRGEQRTVRVSDPSWQGIT